MSNKTVSKLKQKYATRNTNVKKIAVCRPTRGKKVVRPCLVGRFESIFPGANFCPSPGLRHTPKPLSALFVATFGSNASNIYGFCVASRLHSTAPVFVHSQTKWKQIAAAALGKIYQTPLRLTQLVAAGASRSQNTRICCFSLRLADGLLTEDQNSKIVCESQKITGFDSREQRRPWSRGPNIILMLWPAVYRKHFVALQKTSI
jgi:hypothetical protein